MESQYITDDEWRAKLGPEPLRIALDDVQTTDENGNDTGPLVITFPFTSSIAGAYLVGLINNPLCHSVMPLDIANELFALGWLEDMKPLGNGHAHCLSDGVLISDMCPELLQAMHAGKPIPIASDCWAFRAFSVLNFRWLEKQAQSIGKEGGA